MSQVLPQFDPPANWHDFDPGSTQDTEFRKLWNSKVNQWTQSAIQSSRSDYYFNPLTTDIPPAPDSATAAIGWDAFPNRINTTFANESQQTRWKYADEGPPASNPPYHPQGPRGWQDEYCEWSVTRNSSGKITKVMFTCENPEYWTTLFSIDPEKVLSLYQQLVSPQVTMQDITLPSGQYNPLNKWNNSTTNGAVHLISPPNTLGAEIQLAADATVLRMDSNGQPVTQPDPLIRCSRYGTPNRNSDPHIGQQVNQLVLNPPHLRVSLKNPVGLYIQKPNFGLFELPPEAPADASPEDYWKLVRGQGDQGLHAVYEVPEDQGFTVSDITINGFNIDFGSQMTEQFQIQLVGLGIPHAPLPDPVAQPCVGSFAPQPAMMASEANLHEADEHAKARR